VRTLGKLEPAVLAQHTALVVGKLEHSEGFVRKAAVETLGKLEPAVLAQHLDAVKSLLDNEDEDVRNAAQRYMRMAETGVSLCDAARR
jgi:HEAT repeat protein